MPYLLANFNILLHGKEWFLQKLALILKSRLHLVFLCLQEDITIGLKRRNHFKFQIKLIKSISPRPHLLLYGIMYLTRHLCEEERTFWWVDIFDERLINRCLSLWILSRFDKVSLYSLNIVIGWLFLPRFYNICGVYIFLIIIMIPIVNRVSVGLKRNIMVLWNMRNRISLRVKLSFASLSISLGDIFLVFKFKTFLFTGIHLLRNVDLSIRLWLKVLVLVDSRSIEWILVCFSIVIYLGPAIVTFWFEEGVPIFTEFISRLLPVVVCLRVIVFGDEKNCIVKCWRRLLIQQSKRSQDSQDVEGRFIIQTRFLEISLISLIYDVVETVDVWPW